jgi:hypothetical protein
MVLALTMIKVQPGYENSVYRDLQRRSSIRDVYRLFGEFNFFLIMQAERRSMLNNLLNEIKEDGKVIKTGPVLLTVDGDMSEMAYAEAEVAFG